MGQSTSSLRRLLHGDMVILLICAGCKFLLPFAAHPDFEYHRDELLYLAMGEHLDWGYLEVPPLIAVLARASHLLLGDSLFALRFFPALAGAIILFVTGLMVRELGGGRHAQLYAALAMFFSPAYLRSHFLFQPVVFDQLFFALAAYLMLCLLRQDRPALWLALGVVAGVGLLNKYTMLLFGAGLVPALLCTPQRRMLARPWPWLAAGVALALALPNVLWQQRQGWPLLDHLHELSRSQLSHVEPLGFVIMQAMMFFAAAPVWLFGVGFYLFTRDGRPYRALGFMYIVLFMLLLLLRGKSYYLLSAYAMLFAGGAVLLEKLTAGRRARMLRLVLPALLVLGNLPGVPYGVPLLSTARTQDYARYMANHFGLTEPLRWESGRLHALPQDFADMLGWENQAATAARVYQTLTPAEQASCTLLASNYGQAGALVRYRTRYGLPQVVSYNGSFYLWGPGTGTGEILLSVGISTHDLSPFYDEITLAATITPPFARENNVPVLLARRPRMLLAQIWPQLSAYRF